jgi:hypothetical protein
MICTLADRCPKNRYVCLQTRHSNFLKKFRGVVMIEDDNTYFGKRAEAELERARSAATSEAAQIHQRLAKAYQERLNSEPPPSIEQAT